MTTKCPKCNFDNPDTVKFCGECGSKLTSAEEPDASYTKTLETPAEEMPRGTLFAGRYEMIESLGTGGMGKVYRVFDKKLEGEIALKMIKPEIASDKKTLDRFRNEIKLARDIAHRNVCRMYELMDYEDRHFITMEYVSGQDLKGLIRQTGQLAIPTALSIAKQICEGLSEAHRLGVVHRDLKPSNIMIDKAGNAKIMDFGIARSLKTKGITRAGAMIGTPEYISPEQVEGKEVDQRADIYSLGVILYEMVTGRVPFEGETALSVAHKHRYEPPQAPKEVNTQISDDLNSVIIKCLAKDKEQRFQTADELRSELINIERGVPTTDREIPKRKAITSKEITVTFGLKKLLIPVVALVALLIITVAIWKPWQKKTPTILPSGKPSLAVMYFENITGDETLDHWRKGLAELIITDLLQSKYINVLSGDRLFNILDNLNQIDATSYSTDTMKEVASRGGCSHIVRGNYLLAGKTLRVNISLMEANTEKIVATEDVEGEGIDAIFALVDELTKKIRLSLDISAEAMANDLDKDIGKITTNSAEAYRYYVEGHRYYVKGEPRKAIQLFERAVALDPEFAMAYRDLSGAYINLGGYRAEWLRYNTKAFELSDRVSERERLRIHGDYYRVVVRDNQKALEAYIELVEMYPDDWYGYYFSGLIYAGEEEWEEAAKQFEMCIKIDSEHSFTPGSIATVYQAMGLYDKAKKVLEDYLNNIGEASYIRWILAQNYLCKGQYDLAMNETEKLLKFDPDHYFNIGTRGDILLCKGDFVQAEKEYQRFMQRKEPRSKYYGTQKLAALYVLQGKFKEAENLLYEGNKYGKEMQRETPFNMHLAYIHLRLGNPEEAMQLLEGSVVDAYTVRSKVRFLHQTGLVYVESDSIEQAKNVADELKELIMRRFAKKMLRYYYHLMGTIELKNENISTSIEYFNKVISLMPFQKGLMLEPREHALFIDSLAKAYHMGGDLDEAKQNYEQITQLTEGRIYYGDIYAKSFYMLGKIYEEQGDTVKAIEHYEKFLDLWKDADSGIAEVDDARVRLAGLR